MLSILEKSAWIFAIVILLGVSLFIAIFGMPSSTPSIAMSSREVTEQELKSGMSSDQIKDLEELLSGAQGTDGNNGARGSATGRRRGITKVYKVNEGLLQRLNNLTDCQQELSHASSKVKENPDGTVSLEVFGIDPGSLLDRMGLKERDSIEMVSGERLDFNSLPSILSAWEAGVDRLESGNPIVLELNRRGQKVQLVVSPDR